MKTFGVVGTAVVFLAFGTVSGFAQQPEPDKPARQEEPKAEHPKEEKQAKPAKQQEPKAKPAERAPQQNEKRAPENNKQAQDKGQKAQQAQQKSAQADQQRARQDQQKQVQQNQKAQQQNTKAADKARQDQQKRSQQNGDQQVRDNGNHPVAQSQPQGRPAAYNGRIPENNFHEHFGQQHHFRFHRPEVVDGQPRFQYSGYWFQLVDPWPVGWGYDDDVYVDYVDDQYYLFDPEHPGARIVINVVM